MHNYKTGHILSLMTGDADKDLQTLQRQGYFSGIQDIRVPELGMYKDDEYHVILIVVVNGGEVVWESYQFKMIRELRAWYKGSPYFPYLAEAFKKVSANIRKKTYHDAFQFAGTDLEIMVAYFR